MMDPNIIKKVRQLEIKTRHALQNHLVGSYHSLFKGQGINFASVRSYEHGDDSRRIDWNVTARTNSTQVKEFEEERDLTIMLLIDLSASNLFGTCDINKREAAAEIAAACGFSALYNNDRVGLLLFSDHIESYCPPKKGKTHMFRCLRDIFCFTPKNKQTNINLALEKTSKLLHKPSVVFIISDFQDHHYEKSLQFLSKKHTVIPIILEDPSEYTLPKIGLLELKDPETGDHLIINTNKKEMQNKYKSIQATYLSNKHRIFRKTGLRPITINVKESITTPLIRYFKSQK